MKRVAYFGTQGGGIAGHEFTAIVGAFSFEEEREVNRLDSDKTFEVFEGKRQFKFFNYSRYMCLAFPASPDDKRGGSITIALVEGASEQKEVLDAIEASGFMKSQFERLVKMYDIPLPLPKRPMNRIIKFRGKANDSWVYGDLVHDCNGNTLINIEGYSGGGTGVHYRHLVKPETVGQFTGFTDKSNKEIYEGDVLNNGQRNYIVCWNNERGAWWLKNKDLIYTTPLGFLSMELFVIGIVYDNPELINA